MLFTQSAGNTPRWSVQKNLSSDISEDIGAINEIGSTAVYFIKKSRGKWVVAQNGDKKAEMIVVNYPNKQVNLAVKGVKVKSGRAPDRFWCGTNLFIPTGSKACKSEFAVVSYTAKQVVAGLLILPAWVITGTLPRNKIIDTAQLESALKESGLLAYLDQQDNMRWMANYRQEFKSITSSSSAEKFIATYQSSDPNGLVRQARKMRDQYLAQEERQRLAELAQRRAALAQQQALADARAKKEELRVAQARKMVSDYRATVRTGSQSNCGPVLEARGGLVKVYHPVMNYGNEHWIPLNQIFPSNYGCRFYNGQYVVPSY